MLALYEYTHVLLFLMDTYNHMRVPYKNIQLISVKHALSNLFTPRCHAMRLKLRYDEEV